MPKSSREPIPAQPQTAPRGRPRKRLSREERAPDARAEIFAAAVKVVGDVGYASATVEKVTSVAGIAQGTFYLYFKSRQELFNELLPYSGTEMLGFIRDRIKGSRDIYEMEERSIETFFLFMKKNPGFGRIINEAEWAAPEAYQKHFDLLSKHYVDSLQRSVDKGEIRHFSSSDLEVIAHMLMACRTFLHLRYMKFSKGKDALRQAVATYMAFLRQGLT